tara:strand:+ start:163 stop:312 length:150 start_codon:yes stop_codon:yes gene_type:complete
MLDFFIGIWSLGDFFQLFMMITKSKRKVITVNITILRLNALKIDILKQN